LIPSYNLGLGPTQLKD